MKKVARSINILDATRDPHLFGPWFRDPATWKAWTAFLASLWALPLTPEQLAVYQRCTGRQHPPSAPITSAYLVCGRRAGKSFMLALIAVFLACFHEWRQYLAPGERGTVMIVATDRRQARVIFRYIRGLLIGVAMLAGLIERETAESFDLTNSITIEVGSASFRSVRGYTIVAALCDELAFWPNDNSAEPDYEILDALRPGMATIPGAMLLCASSPYSRKGALWDAHRRHFGKDGDPILVWKAPTRVMNPTVPQSIIDEAIERDPASAAAEFMAEFRTDVQALLTREAVEACVALGIRERAPLSGTEYMAFVDPSGGSADSMTLAIGHRADTTAVLDAVREVKPPFSPEGVVEEFAELLRQYRVDRVTGDRYAGEWPREQFRKRDIEYQLAEQPKSAIYQALLPAINSKQVDLLDNARLTNQLIGLERRTARGGRDSIDHAPGAHDDVANSVAGVISLINVREEFPGSDLAWVGGEDRPFDRILIERRIRRTLYG